MPKKLLALLFAVLMMIAMMAGCQQVQDYWVSDEVTVGGDKDDKENEEEKNEEEDEEEGDRQESDSTKKTGRTKKTTTKGAGKTTVGGFGGTAITRKPNSGKNALNFTPVADKGANYKVKGEVSVAVDTARPTDYAAMFDVMMKLYPNVKFTFDYWAHSASDNASEYLSTRASTGTMADIIFDETGSLPGYLRQGWIYPITDMVAKDPEAKNIPANIKADYTYLGELYAVPHQATFQTMVFNTDLLTKLNLKLPSLSWSLKDYEKYLNTAGTSGYDQGLCVGQEFLDDDYASHYNANSKKGAKYGSYAYNYKTKQWDWQILGNSLEQFRKWRVSSKGAEAWFVWSQTNDKGERLLTQKFGIQSYNQAFSAGKALLKYTNTQHVARGDLGTELKFKYQQWPTPNVNGNLMLHVDHCFMTAGVSKANLEAAFQALRFMSYTTNGNLARLQMYEKSEAGKYNLNSPLYYPVTTNATVIKKFNGLAASDKADEFMVKNVVNSSRHDTFKIVPDIGFSTKMSKWWDPITDGTQKAAYIEEPVTELNKELKEEFAEFEKELKEVQKKFNESHK